MLRKYLNTNEIQFHLKYEKNKKDFEISSSKKKLGKMASFDFEVFVFRLNKLLD